MSSESGGAAGQSGTGKPKKSLAGPTSGNKGDHLREARGYFENNACLERRPTNPTRRTGTFRLSGRMLELFSEYVTRFVVEYSTPWYEQVPSALCGFAIQRRSVLSRFGSDGNSVSRRGRNVRRMCAGGVAQRWV